jgi:hypothetical protein
MRGYPVFRVPIFGSSVATIFASIFFTSSIKANAPSMSMFMSTDACAMAASVGGTCRDGDDGSSNRVLGSAAKCKDCATTRLWGAAHGDGNDEPSSVLGLVAEPIN